MESDIVKHIDQVICLESLIDPGELSFSEILAQI